MKSLLILITSVALVGTTINNPAYAIAIYNDLDQFLTAAGPGVQLEDLEGIPLNEDNVAVFSNGDLFGNGAFSISSLTFDSDVVLTDSGLMGTYLVGPKSDNTTINRQLLPGGGGGASDPGDDDDMQFTFMQPVRAFGMLIIENLSEPEERVILNDADGQEVLSLPLPGGSSGGGSTTFLGFVASAEDDYFQTITVEEGQILNDDIGFTWFYFDMVPEPSTFALFTGVLTAGMMRSRRR